MNITTSSPAEIDAEIARINGEINALYSLIETAEESITRYTRSNATYYADAIEAAEVRIADANAALPALLAEIAPFQNEFDARGGWTRFYLVEGGHLHCDVSSYRCSRINTTSHYWLTELSGQTEAEVIELAGDRVCTVCFPNAPVEAQARPSQLFTKSEAEKAQARVEREDKRTKAAATKASKAISNPDGSPLTLGTGRYSDKITTERAASIKLVDELWYNKFYGTNDERQANIELLLNALAAKRNTTRNDELADANKRLAARIKREG